MSGLNLQRGTGEDNLRHVDEHDADRRIRYPSLYVIANVLMLCVLGALVYGLVKIL